MIQKNHSDEFNVDILLNQQFMDEHLEKYDIIHFHRFIPGPNSEEMLQKIKDRGIITICDIDDYWTPPYGHPLRNMVIEKKMPERILWHLKNADYVTTTTKLFQNEMKSRGIDSHIIPNAIDHLSPQWKNNIIDSDVVRVGWIGGSSHEKDLAKLSGTFNKLLSDKELDGKFKIVLCGYDTRGTVTEKNPVTGEEKVRKIRPEESIWNKFENIFSVNGKAGDTYVRRNTLPINQYGKHYNYVDICLAPLVDNVFNKVKSELKIIESGMMSKAIIASDNSMARELLTHGENGMLVNSKKDHKLWYRYIKELILDNELRNKLSKNLHELVYPDYTLEKVTAQRCEWYKELLNNETT